ncbi:MAG: hypothetical protein GY792_13240 [Gammaproteobacteria bacterium]|nr:hypothetical protein [Gammaproteobacteria bacterium]
MRVYDRMAKQEDDPDGMVLLMGWDNIPVRSEKSLHDLAMWAQENDDLAKYLMETTTAELAEQISPLPGGERSGPTLRMVEVVRAWDEFASRFQSHLDQFGHIIFQLDFAEPLPLDHPEMMLENIKMYLRGEGNNPHERQKTSEQKRIQTTETMLNRLKDFKLRAFRKALNWGQSMAEVREDALAEIGLAYPKIRELLHEMGGASLKGVLSSKQMIFSSWRKKKWARW